MRKALTFLLIALIAVTSVFANGSSESSGKTEVYFLNFKPEIADVYTSVVEPAFEAAYPQYDLKVVTAASNQYQQTLRSELTKSAPPTIFQVNGPVGIAENVTTVEMLDDVLLTAGHCLNNDQALKAMLEERGVNKACGAKVTQVTDDAVVYEKDGQTVSVPADTVIIAAGYRSNNELEDQLEGLVDDLSVVGDAVAPRKILTAVHEGYHAIRVME